MMRTLVILSLTLGLVLADPVVARITNADATNTSVDTVDVNAAKRSPRHVLPTTSFLYDLACTWVGRFINIQSVALFVMNWIVYNFTTIAVGALAALGFCKMTNRCSLQYESYIPVSRLTKFVTADSIDTAERFLLTALDKYQKR